MKNRGWLALLIGGGLVLGAAALRGGWMAAHALSAADSVALVQVWLWLPWWPDGWQLALLALGLALWGLALVGYVWQRRSASSTRPTRGTGPSAFAVDPWSDTAPVMDDDAPDSVQEQVHTLQRMAQRLEARGRLHAARELYRQAYELVAHDPGQAEHASQLLLALRKLERRLARQRAPWWRRLWAHLAHLGVTAKG